MKTIDQRIVEIEQSLNSVSAALQNTIMAVVTALNEQPGFDRSALKQELEDLKGVQIQGGNQQLYLDSISMVQERLS